LLYDSHIKDNRCEGWGGGLFDERGWLAADSQIQEEKWMGRMVKKVATDSQIKKSLERMIEKNLRICG